MSLRHQCELLAIPRSTYYHEPRPTPAADLLLMRELDELFMEEPTWGSRKLAAHFQLHGRVESRERITRLRRLMGLATIYQQPRTTLPGPQPQRYPYLLRGLEINRPDHVWCADITYVPMKTGAYYLFAMMDWATRYVTGWALSNTLDADYCIRCLKQVCRARPRRTPEIFNTDQGSQFTSRGWVRALAKQKITISHDGKGRWMDNVFIERLWRSIKYDDIYLRSYADGHELERGVTRWFQRYNHRRPHETLGNITPAMAYAKK
jgi:putative transposase